MVNIVEIKDLEILVRRFFEEKECFPLSYLEAKKTKVDRFDCYYKFRCDPSIEVITVVAISRLDIYSGNSNCINDKIEIKSLNDFLQGEWITNHT